VGSTNLDYRSFGINDEVNLAVFNSEVATTLTHAFEDDVAHSRHITLDEWKKRGLIERGLEDIGWIFERQQ
jgi:cardiolipin synthase